MAGAGHNPLAALSVFALIGLFAFQALSGLAASDDIAFSGPLAYQMPSALSSQLTFWHRWNEELIYILLALHVLAILVYRLRGQHLLGPMIHGRKHTADTQAQESRGGGVVALLIALAIAACVVWLANGSWLG